jgi:hypothetical protein
MAVLAAPVVIAGLDAVLVWLGWTAGAVAAAAIASELAKKARVNAKMKQWALDHPTTLKEDLEKKEPREPTPFTHPQLFSDTTISNTKVHLSNGLQEVWAVDMLHANEFEVYASRKHYETGKRNRVVFLDGRLNKVKTALLK